MKKYVWVVAMALTGFVGAGSAYAAGDNRPAIKPEPGD